MSSISSSIRAIDDLLRHTPLYRESPAHTAATPQPPLSEIVSQATRAVQSNTTEGFLLAFRCLTQARALEQRHSFLEPTFIPEVDPARIQAIVSNAIDQLRLIALRLEDDPRNTDLCTALRYTADRYLAPALHEIQEREFNQAHTTIDLGLVVVEDLWRCIWGDFKEPAEARVRWPILPLVYGGKEGNFELVKNPETGVEERNFNLKIAWFDIKSTFEAFSNITTDTATELLREGFELPFFRSVYNAQHGSDLTPADELHSLNLLMREMSYLARCLFPKQSNPPQNNNEHFAVRLYDANFNLEQALGGGLLAAINSMLGTETATEELSSEERFEKLLGELRAVRTLLHAGAVDELVPARQTEAGRAILPYMLRIVRGHLARTLAALEADAS